MFHNKQRGIEYSQLQTGEIMCSVSDMVQEPLSPLDSCVSHHPSEHQSSWLLDQRPMLFWGSSIKSLRSDKGPLLMIATIGPSKSFFCII